ncbi:hypothetical protein, partial [Streptomyces sp. NPDC052042]|uniref:hypothetical protein n=1 Tax=Streptomyces sp. NPDC052042 TaxID=3365683 RepID=UPI0037D354DB
MNRLSRPDCQREHERQRVNPAAPVTRVGHLCHDLQQQPQTVFVQFLLSVRGRGPGWQRPTGPG